MSNNSVDADFEPPPAPSSRDVGPGSSEPSKRPRKRSWLGALATLLVVGAIGTIAYRGWVANPAQQMTSDYVEATDRPSALSLLGNGYYELSDELRSTASDRPIASAARLPFDALVTPGGVVLSIFDEIRLGYSASDVAVLGADTISDALRDSGENRFVHPSNRSAIMAADDTFASFGMCVSDTREGAERMGDDGVSARTALLGVNLNTARIAWTRLLDAPCADGSFAFANKMDRTSGAQRYFFVADGENTAQVTDGYTGEVVGTLPLDDSTGAEGVFQFAGEWMIAESTASDASAAPGLVATNFQTGVAVETRSCPSASLMWAGTLSVQLSEEATPFGRCGEGSSAVFDREAGQWVIVDEPLWQPVEPLDRSGLLGRWIFERNADVFTMTDAITGAQIGAFEGHSQMVYSLSQQQGRVLYFWRSVGDGPLENEGIVVDTETATQLARAEGTLYVTVSPHGEVLIENSDLERAWLIVAP